MSSCSNAQPYEVGGCSNRKALNSFAKKISEAGNGQLEPEEDEDEDIDFNPFLKSTPSEASSSLSSEIDGLDADVDYVDNSFVSKENSLSIEVTNDLQDVNDRYSENEEVVMQTGVSIGGACEKELEDAVPVKTKKRKLTFYSPSESETVQDASSYGADAVNDATRGDCPDPRQSTMSLLDSDDEDAICKRTRARYSLANFTLDELETYLQESDDSDEFQNVNDEEEYRKFLAAVLQGGDGEGQTIPENENADDDDDDEDNDADFEIEIEEALESDPDGSTQVKGQKEHYDRNGRRPETRQNRRQKASAQSKEKLLGQARRPLRPLLPLVSNTPIAPFSGFDWQRSMPEAVMHLPSSSAQSGLVNGFTPHQIGQLYCLIHEHVQLLIQVFSLCVLEPSRRHIASEVRKLISEMVNERDEVLSWKNMPYPGFCFHPPYIQPSVLDGLPHSCHVRFPVDSSLAADAHRNHPTSNMFLDSWNTSPSEGSHNECFPTRHADPCQPTRDSFWLPFISGPVLSILDVAPLNLVGRYITDVSTALQEYQKRHVEAIHDTHFEREPLFPLPSFPSFVENSCEISRGSNPPGFDSVPTSLPVQQQPKKTLAAALVESTKKQSVALVPKEIVKLAQRFFPLFNTALFPHKPPPAAVANRVLFTDAEDELLALGLMEYNTDWKAIQQRFLPCKSKHQIFVRQKNRCSSKAPENPIKAVRRLKTSPLSAEEKARIHEGLRVLKLDWMSIWKFILPYRDPSLLPRQWRIALGSQKSYKTDGAKKEKRRLYESNRRKIKAAAFARLQIGSEKEDNPTENAGVMNNSGDDYMDDEDGSYVHEAFLADWRPGVSGLMSSDFPCSSLKKGNSSGGLLPQNDAYNGEQLPGHGIPDHVRYSSSYTSNRLVSDLTTKSFKSQSHLRPYRLRRSNRVQVVKLAPDLPPVNLPPSVRVISQFALKNYACQSPTEVRNGCACNGAAIDDMVPGLPQVAKSGISHLINAGKNRSSPSNQDSIILSSQDQGLPTDKYTIEEKGAESDLQMHPLLFQASEDGRLPCYPFNSFIAAANSRNFFSGTQLQANLNFFNEPHQNGPPVDCFYKSLRSKESPSTSCTIDFHPLLQRTDDITTETVVASSPAHPSMAVQSSQGSLVRLQKHANSALTEPKIKSVLSANGVEPASTCEKANDLDLEIHLCSTSCREKDVSLRSRGVSQQNSDGPTISALDSITVTDKHNYENSKCKPASYIPSIMGNRQILPGANARVVSSNNISIYADNNVGDPSLPEIVMEQEELSDSDEDGEHVEFEFEEMADTEEEGSDNEQLAGTQNKEVLLTAIEKESISDADRVDLQRDTRICSGPQFDDTCTPAKGNTHSWKKGFSGKGREKGNTVQLSLDSCTPACYTQQEPEYTREKGNNQTNQGSSQNDARSRLSRTHRRITSDANSVSAQTHTQDMLQQLHLGSTEAPSAAPAVRKHKKRICRSNSANTNT